MVFTGYVFWICVVKTNNGGETVMFTLGSGIAIGGISISAAAVIIKAISQNGKYVTREEYSECIKRLDGNIADIKDSLQILIKK